LAHQALWVLMAAMPLTSFSWEALFFLGR
jgi:hypothetical protein